MAKKNPSPRVQVVVTEATKRTLDDLAARSGGTISDVVTRLLSLGLLEEQHMRELVRDAVIAIAQAIAADAEPERRVARLGELLGSQSAAEGVAAALHTIIEAGADLDTLESEGVLNDEGWAWQAHEDGVLLTFVGRGVRYFVPEYDGAFLIVSNQRGETRKQTWNALYNEWSTAEMEAGEILALAPYLAAIQEQRAKFNT